MRMALGKTLIYSGDEKLHMGGVALMISQQAKESHGMDSHQQEDHNSKILLDIGE